MACPTGNPLADAVVGFFSFLGNPIGTIVEGIANAVLAGAIAVFGELTTSIPTLSSSGTSQQVNNQTQWVVVYTAVGSLIFASIRMALERRGEAGATALKGLLRVILVAGAATTVVTLLAGLSDRYADYLFKKGAYEQLTSNIGCQEGNGIESFLLLVLAFLLLIAAILHTILLYIRLGVMIVLLGTLPLAAAASMTDWGDGWWRKHIGWMIAWLLYKPAAGLVMYAGSAMISDGHRQRHPRADRRYRRDASVGCRPARPAQARCARDRGARRRRRRGQGDGDHGRRRGHRSQIARLLFGGQRSGRIGGKPRAFGCFGLFGLRSRAVRAPPAAPARPVNKAVRQGALPVVPGPALPVVVLPVVRELRPPRVPPVRRWVWRSASPREWGRSHPVPWTARTGTRATTDSGSCADAYCCRAGRRGPLRVPPPARPRHIAAVRRPAIQQRVRKRSRRERKHNHVYGSRYASHLRELAPAQRDQGSARSVCSAPSACSAGWCWCCSRRWSRWLPPSWCSSRSWSSSPRWPCAPRTAATSTS